MWGGEPTPTALRGTTKTATTVDSLPKARHGGIAGRTGTFHPGDGKGGQPDREESPADGEAAARRKVGVATERPGGATRTRQMDTHEPGNSCSSLGHNPPHNATRLSSQSFLYGHLWT